MPRALRSVTPDETRKAPTTVAEAVEVGTRRDELMTMRARIARAIDDPNIKGADLAALTRRLLEIGRELEVVDTRAAEEALENAEATPDGAWEAV